MPCRCVCIYQGEGKKNFVYVVGFLSVFIFIAQLEIFLVAFLFLTFTQRYPESK